MRGVVAFVLGSLCLATWSPVEAVRMSTFRAVDAGETDPTTDVMAASMYNQLLASTDEDDLRSEAAPATGSTGAEGVAPVADEMAVAAAEMSSGQAEMKIAQLGLTNARAETDRFEEERVTAAATLAKVESSYRAHVSREEAPLEVAEAALNATLARGHHKVAKALDALKEDGEELSVAMKRYGKEQKIESRASTRASQLMSSGEDSAQQETKTVEQVMRLTQAKVAASREVVKRKEAARDAAKTKYDAIALAAKHTEFTARALFTRVKAEIEEKLKGAGDARMVAQEQVRVAAARASVAEAKAEQQKQELDRVSSNMERLEEKIANAATKTADPVMAAVAAGAAAGATGATGLGGATGPAGEELAKEKQRASILAVGEKIGMLRAQKQAADTVLAKDLKARTAKLLRKKKRVGTHGGKEGELRADGTYPSGYAAAEAEENDTMSAEEQEAKDAKQSEVDHDVALTAGDLKVELSLAVEDKAKKNAAEAVLEGNLAKLTEMAQGIASLIHKTNTSKAVLGKMGAFLRGLKVKVGLEDWTARAQVQAYAAAQNGRVRKAAAKVSLAEKNGAILSTKAGSSTAESDEAQQKLTADEVELTGVVGSDQGGEKVVEMTAQKAQHLKEANAARSKAETDGQHSRAAQKKILVMTQLLQTMLDESKGRIASRTTQLMGKVAAHNEQIRAVAAKEGKARAAQGRLVIELGGKMGKLRALEKEVVLHRKVLQEWVSKVGQDGTNVDILIKATEQSPERIAALRGPKNTKLPPMWEHKINTLINGYEHGVEQVLKAHDAAITTITKCHTRALEALALKAQHGTDHRAKGLGAGCGEFEFNAAA